MPPKVRAPAGSAAEYRSKKSKKKSEPSKKKPRLVTSASPKKKRVKKKIKPPSDFTSPSATSSKYATCFGTLTTPPCTSTPVTRQLRKVTIIPKSAKSKKDAAVTTPCTSAPVTRPLRKVTIIPKSKDAAVATPSTRKQKINTSRPIIKERIKTARSMNLSEESDDPATDEEKLRLKDDVCSEPEDELIVSGEKQVTNKQALINQKNHGEPWDFEVLYVGSGAISHASWSRISRWRIKHWRLQPTEEGRLKYKLKKRNAFNEQDKRDRKRHRRVGRRQSAWLTAGGGTNKFVDNSECRTRNTVKISNRRIRRRASALGLEDVQKTVTYNASEKCYESELIPDSLDISADSMKMIDGRTQARIYRQAARTKQRDRQVQNLTDEVKQLKASLEASVPAYAAQAANVIHSHWDEILNQVATVDRRWEETFCTNGELVFNALKRAKVCKLVNDLPQINFGLFIRSFVCLEPTDKCYTGNCDQCKNNVTVSTLMEGATQAVVSFRFWAMHTDDNGYKHMKLDYKTLPLKPFCEFVVNFMKNKYLEHFNNVKKQSAALRELKHNSEPGTMVVQVDFSQKYTPTNNCEIQNAFFGKVQISLFPVHIRVHRLNGSWEMYSYVVVSDCVRQTHDEVKAYLNKLYEVIGQKHWFQDVKKVVYVSDGSSAQFKNRFNFWNLCYHVEDYNLVAEWHFSPTSHGKGPCDALGGVYKRTGDRLTNFDQTTTITPAVFSSLVEDQLIKTKVIFVEKAYVEQVKATCHQRQQLIASTMPPTVMVHKTHYFRPSFNEIGTLSVSFHSCKCIECVASPIGHHCQKFQSQVRTVSLVAGSTKRCVRQVTPKAPPIPTAHKPSTSDPYKDLPFPYKVGDHVAAIYDGKWFIGEILELNGDDFFIQFMKRLGEDLNENRFRLCTAAEQRSEKCDVPKEDVLCRVDAPGPISATRTERLKLTSDDFKKVVEEYKYYIDMASDNDDDE